MRTLTPKEEALLRKYKARLESEFSEKVNVAKPAVSRSYQTFRRENLPRHASVYERLCNAAYRMVKISPGKKAEAGMKQYIALSHLATSPGAVYSLAVLAMLLAMLPFLAYGAFTQSLGTILFGLLVGVLVLGGLLKLPEFMANNWRLRASNQMVQCIFYVVTYMRHTSNLEQAVRFAADHLTAPLSLDLKKVLWDTETGKCESVQASLDSYLETWKDYNPEFIEAFHLIEGSLYEASETKRLGMVDKALAVMLQETYEKMLRYTHDLKSPITMLYMLGIILPVLGLVILPMVASFMTTDIAPLQLAGMIALLYNILLPAIILYLGRMLLSQRPTGYGDTDISEQFPALKGRGKIGIGAFRFSPLWLAVAVASVMLLIGLFPLLLGSSLPDDVLLSERPFDAQLNFKLLEYRQTSSGVSGPYGLGASIISLFLPLGLGIGAGLYYFLRSRNIMRIRQKTKKLESEFSAALFQLGNRLGDGMPAEIAFEKVAEVTKGSETGRFFERVTANLRRRGVSVEAALFDKRYGAVRYFPSAVIESSMKVLVESVRKGPKVAAEAMVNISEYIRDIHRVDERLKDLLAELISDMKQQIQALTPAIAGIVVGITAMIVTILGRLSEQLASITSGSGTIANVPSGLISLFGDGIPTYYFQAIVGVYVIQIVYILTVLVNGIENGSDKLAERYQLGQNLLKSTLIYSVIALVVIVLFSVMAAGILQNIVTT